MFSSPPPLFVTNFRQCDNFIKNASLRGTTQPKRKSVLSCTFPCFPVSQTTKINLLLLNVVVVVVLLSSCRYLPRSSIGLGIFSAALKVQRNLIKCSSLSLSWHAKSWQKLSPRGIAGQLPGTCHTMDYFVIA